VRKPALLLPLLASIISVVTAQASGQVRVSGTVTDSAGGSLPHAFVEALPLRTSDDRGTVGDRANPWTPADAEGKFSFVIPPGRYRIRGKDELDGYPDPVYWLNADSSAIFPEMTIAENGITDVHVVLGKRGGLLSGEVIDRSSRHPVPNAKVTFRDAHNADAYVEVFADKDGRFQFAVPGKPILVSASAAGHKTGKLDGGAELTLSGGEHKDIVLDLAPE